MKKPLLSLAILALSIGAHTVHAENKELRGTGSSFAAGAYTSWGFSYAKEKSVSVVYQATGSGDGIRQIMARNVDFGATDYPLSSDQLKKNGLLQFPTLISGIVPVVNLPGIKPGQLKLTGPLLAAIFSGRIANWNDAEIRAVNPKTALPGLPIKRIVRADDSGTTAGFTEYLSRVDPEWASRHGSGLQVKWPKGSEPAKSSDGVAAALTATAGSVAYLPANQVNRSKLSYVLLQNRNKQFVAPTDDALVAAVKSSSINQEGERISFVDMPAPNVWPITDATYVLVERAPKNPENTARVLRFFYWAFLRGDAMATDTGYVPLPPAIQARAVSIFREAHDSQNNPLNFMSSNGATHLAQWLRRTTLRRMGS